MASPNKTVAAFRNAKWTMVREQSVRDQFEQSDVAERTRAAFPGPRYSVRTSSFAIGPRGGNGRSYVVRVYDRGEV